MRVRTPTYEFWGTRMQPVTDVKLALTQYILESPNRKFRSPYKEVSFGKFFPQTVVPLGHQCFENESIAKEQTTCFRNLHRERQIKINREMKGSWMTQR